MTGWDATTGWDAATVGLTPPFAVVDLDAFDANATDLEHRAGGTPIRLASKSLRCRALIRRALDRPGFSGVMAYAAQEALWLVRTGVSDVFVAYPTVDRDTVREVAADGSAVEQVTFTVDSVAHVDLLSSAAGPHPLRVCLDVDSSLRVGRAHLGVRRSPLRTTEEVLHVARAAMGSGLRVVGLMFYDAQIAGLPDTSPAVRLVKKRSHADLLERRREIVTALGEVTDLQFVNGGGTGSLHITGLDPSVTELAAGSGLYGPTLFDGYDDFTPRPAAAYALPVVRRPGRRYVTVHGGGYIASGPPGWSRVPSVHRPRGLRLLRTEGMGEVQTPLRGDVADTLHLGDRVWLRHAKAGELSERFDEYHLVSGGAVVDTVPTYRGEGRNFG
jgi:D-serine deaminase-like pyridoxal phosphate-dependent protein